MSRRTLLRGAAGGGLAVALLRASRPIQLAARSRFIDPYIGALPLVFPLAGDSYVLPLTNNWHASRQGDRYPWTHANGATLRAHDGVDIYPLADEPSPVVYAPLAGRVAAVCLRSVNSLGAGVSYQESASTPPPWDYSAAIDPVEELPLYGNFVWLVSTEPDSAGYYIFVCHLQYEPLLQALVPDQPVEADTPLGVLGDTGNAAGVPQLHVEIHYPAGTGFRCGHCSPPHTVTSLDPYASLLGAAVRDPDGAPVRETGGSRPAPRPVPTR
jgi:murein DD-endopeptidase MepM/ murein hydrolase activator NlpD